MAHIGLVVPPLRGHMDPMTALGNALAARGHTVTVFGDAAVGRLTAPPLGFRDLALPEPSTRFEAALAGGAGITATIRAMATRTDALCAALPAALRDEAVDALLVDQTEAAGALAALACGIPYAMIANALPLNREPDLPPPYVDWAYRADGGRRWLYEGGHRVTDWLMAPLGRVIRARSGGALRRLDDTFSARLQIFQLVQGLDYPRRRLPATAHHVGPLRPADKGRFDAPDDGRPLAFCSLGTLQGHRADLFAALAAGVAAAGLRPVIAHGGRLAPEAAASLPGDPIVADFLPQRAVLARCRLAVVNGGLNTVLDALAAAVPVIVTPIAYEQGAIAARVIASGAGLAVKPRRAARDLAGACRRILADPGFARRAGALAAEIAAAGGVARAADLIETTLLGDVTGGGSPARSASGPGSPGDRTA